MKHLFLIVLAVFITNCAVAQVSAAFLTDEIYQNNAINPAYFPKGRVFIGLPVISGTSLNINSPLNYDNIFLRLSDGTNEINFDRILNNLENDSYLGVQLRINDFYVGYRRNQAAISFFINDRVESDLYLPKSLLNLAINGNRSSIGNIIDFSNLTIKATHFREFGFSYTFFDKKDRFSLGYRAKLLNGFYNASLANNFSASLTTGDDLSLNLQVQNALLRVTTVPTGGSFITSPNIGFGFDLGANYNFSERFSIGVSIRDIGLIRWKNGNSSYQLDDTNFNYSGIDLEDIEDLTQAIDDSLSGQFNFVDDITDPYTDWLPLSGNLTGSWKFGGSSQVVASLSPRLINGFVQMQYGLGLSQKLGRILKINVSANKLPRQDYNVGAALALNLGAIQLYGGTDRTLNYDLTRVKNFNYTFGINLVFGREKAVRERQKYPSTFRLLGGKGLKVRGKDKIYLIIKKQKRKPPVNR